MARLPNNDELFDDDTREYEQRIRQVKADPKQGKRHIADFDEWTIIRRLKLGPCRVCHKQPYHHGLHHLVARSLGGDDLPNNLVPLCGSGTMGCHGAVEARSPVACGRLRDSLTAAERKYVIERKSRWWLNARYPHYAEDVQATGRAEAS